LVPANPSFRSILNVARRGSLLGDPSFGEIVDLAGSVRKISANLWKADSATTAAAWLLKISHINADLDGGVSHDVAQISARPSLVCFRGQPARYSELTPSLFRFDGETRRQRSLANAWFHVALQIWTDANFGFRGEAWLNRNYRLDSSEIETLAQHYEIGTELVDWTWDPTIAICFAAHRLETESADCEQARGRVMLRTIDPESNEQALLAPTFARRIWHQKGLFQRQPDPSKMSVIRRELPGLGDLVAARQLVSSYPSIVFSCSISEKATAVERIRELLSEDDPLLPLAEWALLTAVHVGEPPSKSLKFSPNFDQLHDQLPDDSVCELRALTAGERRVRLLEDVNVMVDYVEQVAARSAGSTIRYDPAGLYLLARAMTDRYFLCLPQAVATDPRIATLSQFMSRPDYFWTLAKDGHFGCPALWPPRSESIVQDGA
jgi:hypothetical protein